MNSLTLIKKREIAGFLVVGLLGLAVDAGTFLVFFHALNLGHYVARFLAFAIAVTMTWLLNRTFTFQTPRSACLYREYLAYVSAQSLGILISLGVYAFCIITSDVLKEYPVFALLVSSGSAMSVNFVLMRFFVFTSE